MVTIEEVCDAMRSVGVGEGVIERVAIILNVSEKSQKGTPDETFERFWRAFPNKVGKIVARRAWSAKRLSREIDAILAGVERYVRDKPVDRPWLNPSTYLNQRRWEDQPAPVSPPLYDARKDGLALLLKDIERRENESGQGQIAGENVRGISGERRLLSGPDSGDDNRLP